MADFQALTKLRQGVEIWNQWKFETGIKPDLSNEDLSGLELDGINLNHANLRGSNLCKTSLISAVLLYADLRDTNLEEANLSEANLYKANASKTKAVYTRFQDANIDYADFNGAVLTHANLRRLQALSTNFDFADLTGVCIEDWHINAKTKLDSVICKYFFKEYKYAHQYSSRRPSNGEFASGDFSKIVQKTLETVDLFFFTDGIDWKAFLSTFQDLQVHYGNENVTIQGIERKSDSGFEIRLAVTEEVDKVLIEQEAYKTYETKLQELEAQYRAELKVKDREIESYRRESASMVEITKLLASRPINVEANAMTNDHSNRTSYDLSNSRFGGGFAAEGGIQNGGTLYDFSQNIEQHDNEIRALLGLLKDMAQVFPITHQGKILEHLSNLEEEVQTPDKRRLSRLKASLAALLAIAVGVGGAVATATDFANNVLELSKKLNVPIEQVQIPDGN